MSALPHEAYVAALASLEGVGPARLRWLLSGGTPAEVYAAVREGRLRDAPSEVRVDAGLREAWRDGAARLDPAALWERCGRLGIGVVTIGSAAYPPALRDDPDPPVVLFHRGDPDVLAGPRVAVIGTRRATGYGIRVAERFGRELAEAGVSVVSGLALGIDAAAHRGATSVAGAPPVAVVGGGLDDPCPVRNRALAEAVAERGVVLSEVPPGVAAAPWRFSQNRIETGAVRRGRPAAIDRSTAGRTLAPTAVPITSARATAAATAPASRAETASTRSTH